VLDGTFFPTQDNLDNVAGRVFDSTYGDAGRNNDQKEHLSSLRRRNSKKFKIHPGWFVNLWRAAARGEAPSPLVRN